ncbi:MAG: 2,3-bisphosphoglycerate-independent phosphoglycerate mutase [Eubacteriales bacterium]
MAKKLTALIILDGFGYSKETEAQGNAVRASKIENILKLKEKYPHTLIGASGLSVGLPDGQMGNSEVGHLNIGAGRVVYQALTRVSKDIKDGGFFENAEIEAAVQNAKNQGTALHLYGLISDGGVHSHNTHVYAFVEKAKKAGLTDVFIHCFMDGRDVPPDSGKGYIEELEAKLAEIGVGKIASVMGRYYAMDRDNRWERVQLAYDTMVLGNGKTSTSAVDVMQASYDEKVFDEFVIPTGIVEDGKPVGLIKENDTIICFNFRPDRARQITRAFIDPEFDGFEHTYFPVYYCTLTEYDATFKNVHVIYGPQSLKNTFGEYLADQGKTQFRIAETEKYAHVTFFFNGGVEEPNKGEDRFLIPSPKVATYDLKPEMSAYEVADKAIEKINSGEYDVMVLNFANSDMVGHTGIIQAATDAVYAVDKCAEKVVEAILKNGGEAIITADHGNAERMVDTDGGPFTAHTTNPVPFVLVSDRYKDAKLKQDGILADLAPTLLDLMGLEKPSEMTGTSMIIK